MTDSARMGHYWRLVVGARVLALMVLAVPILIATERDPSMSLLVIGTSWAAITVVERLTRLRYAIHAIEALIVGGVAGLSLDDGPAGLAVLAALAVPPFTAGLRGGVGAAGFAILCQMLAVFVAQGGDPTPDVTTDAVTALFTWSVTGVGLGLIACYLHLAVLTRKPDPLAPYREAQRLIRELLDLSGDLRSGLDPVTLGSRIAVEVRNVVPVAAVAVYSPRGDELTPLVTGAVSSRVDRSLLRPLAERAWRSDVVEVEEERFGLPLHNDGAVVAVVSGMLLAGRDETALGVNDRVSSLASDLEALTVQLDTAMQFARLRDAATAGERRRLARDLHDGVAQDIASLGYLVDALAASPTSPGQAQGLERLRERISAVVAQVRSSVQTLRTDVEASESLGAAISGLARHLGESSNIPIRVTVNERTTRLRPEVESELLRIAQEAMTNAVRHSGASLIDVDCRVAAPNAEITVRDDGAGLGPGRADSYGLAIMRERAELIDADLSIEAAEPAGTVVRVRVPSRRASVAHTKSIEMEKVTV